MYVLIALIVHWLTKSQSTSSYHNIFHLASTSNGRSEGPLIRVPRALALQKFCDRFIILHPPHTFYYAQTTHYFLPKSMEYTDRGKNNSLHRYLRVASKCILWVIELLESCGFFNPPPPILPRSFYRIARKSFLRKHTNQL